MLLGGFPLAPTILLTITKFNKPGNEMQMVDEALIEYMGSLEPSSKRSA
jgi:hypothetical protein